MAALMPFGARSAERISMRVSPSVAFAPADLIVRTTIEASDENRAIEIVAESGDFYRSSEQPLDGERAPRTTELHFRSLPEGEYIVSAVLKGAGDERLAVMRREIRVVASHIDR
jgi:hypothetical protein